MSASGTIGMYTSTRSPFVTPHRCRAAANRFTSRWSSRKVRVRLCPNSGLSQRIAGRSPFPATTWRSTAL